jgi:hypothetical protein
MRGSSEASTLRRKSGSVLEGRRLNHAPSAKSDGESVQLVGGAAVRGGSADVRTLY